MIATRSDLTFFQLNYYWAASEVVCSPGDQLAWSSSATCCGQRRETCLKALATRLASLSFAVWCLKGQLTSNIIIADWCEILEDELCSFLWAVNSFGWRSVCWWWILSKRGSLDAAANFTKYRPFYGPPSRDRVRVYRWRRDWERVQLDSSDLIVSLYGS